MRHKLILLTCLISIATGNTLLYGQSRISINVPSAQTESAYIWENISSIGFFDRNGYKVSWPTHSKVEQMKQLARTDSLGFSYKDTLTQLMIDSIYNGIDYMKGFQQIAADTATLAIAISRLDSLKRHWDFYTPTQYNVNLTLYGPGGSYNPQSGTILIQTYPNGGFKGNSNPTYTIIHEIVHIGIEEAIVTRYKLSHTQKERLVDIITKTLFADLLPNYQLQSFGDSTIDPFVANKMDIQNLPNRMEQYKNPTEQNNL